MTDGLDVAVVGAGPAGAAIAWRLARAGCRVALLERSRFDAPRVGESLAPGVTPLLAELGAWDDFLALQPLPSYGTHSVWGSPELQSHSHLFTPYGNGWHVDRSRFDRMLAEHAAAAGARLRLGCRVVHVEAASNGGSVLQVEGDGRPLRADLLIDATGRQASLARWVGARHAVFDRLVGVAVPLDDPAAASHGYTLVETTPDGWWYCAPIGPRRSMAMLMTDADLARRHAQGGVAGWHAALRHAGTTTSRIGKARPQAAPAVVPAVSRRLVRSPAPTCQRWLAVGDAALAVDPVSGSGVLRALRTAAAGARAALAALAGDADAVGAYEQQCDDDCRRYLAEWAAYYAAEPRWRASPFWQRRVQGVRAGTA
jgi:flavin-dependent dehydrogenase